jgi:PAS domain S-box-containing protein
MAGSGERSQSRARTRRSLGVADFEELFHLLIENVRDYAIFILDADGYVLTWNVGVRRLLGYEEREFLGLHFKALFRADDQDGALREMERATAVGRSEDERWHLRKDGTEVWISGVLTALRDPAGKLRGFAKIMRDSTAQRTAAIERDELLRRELRAREQAEEANRTKDAFLATISHELRTPLNAMLGWARMLAAGQLDELQARRATIIIERNARAQAQLVGELLDVSRIATGKLRLNLERISLSRVVENAVESLQQSASAKAVSIRTSLSDKPATIDGDGDRLQQVILNLLSNAIKFTPTGGAIDVELAATPECAQLTVRDTGKGITPDLLPHIFDQFQQGERGEAPTSGLGLGLSIARHIVELHRGTIDAQSEGEGKGATFVVQLPTAKLEDGEPASAIAAEPPVARRPELRDKHALVIEDQQDCRSLAVFVLEGCGMRVSTADSVAAAFEILTAEAIDVIVSDIRLEGAQDGLDLIRDLRARETPLARTPALAVTGYADQDDRVRALAAGYDLHLPKPIDPEHLIEAVTAILR